MTRRPPAPLEQRAARAGRLLIALLALAPGGAAEEHQLPAEADARARGPAALASILPLVDSKDPDVRVRARALAERLVLDYSEAQAPEGRRLVPGQIRHTAHTATCDQGFYLGVHEVTLREFREFARKSGLADRWAEGDGNLPATNVSLEEARAFASAKGARLPTLDELSKAARGGGRLRYPWGDRFDPARVNSREAGLGRPEPVGSRKAGVSVHGIADLLGNVAEWTETPADRHRFLVAGGSYRWYAQSPPAPYKLEASSRLPDVGFRLAKSLPPLLTDAPE
ncbi:MAG: formylglycine-generating enzyme family protein, partial [Planctomycetota bacterium]